MNRPVPCPVGQHVPHLLGLWRARFSSGAALDPRGSRSLPDGRLTGPELYEAAAAVKELSRGFTRERGLAGAPYMDDPGLLGGYLLFYWTVSFAQTWAALLSAGLLPGTRLEGRRVLDLGAGPGPSSLALLAAGAGTGDRRGPQRAGPRDRRRAGAPFGAAPRDPCRRPRLGRAAPRRAVRSRDRRAHGERALVGPRRPGGPAPRIRRTPGRTSHPWRQGSARGPGAHGDGERGHRAAGRARGRRVAGARALHARGPVPGAARPGTCHADVAWDPPPAVRRIGHAARIGRESLAFSYFLLEPRAARRPDRRQRAPVCTVSSRIASSRRAGASGCCSAAPRAGSPCPSTAAPRSPLPRRSDRSTATIS